LLLVQLDHGGLGDRHLIARLCLLDSMHIRARMRSVNSRCGILGLVTGSTVGEGAQMGAAGVVLLGGYGGSVSQDPLLAAPPSRLR
jgi:hypothetical protein